MKQKQNVAKKKLVLSKQTIQRLGATELGNVVGGMVAETEASRCLDFCDTTLPKRHA